MYHLMYHLMYQSGIFGKNKSLTWENRMVPLTGFEPAAVNYSCEFATLCNNYLSFHLRFPYSSITV